MSVLLTKCTVCQALIDEEDLFCANCGTEAPPRDDARRDAVRMATHNFECSGCGASMSYAADVGTLRCPFCGSKRLEQQADAKVLAPDRVVPFAIDREAAVASMRGFLGQGFWRPGDLSQQAMVVSTTPVYVPYWVFEATTHTHWAADTNSLPAFSIGKWRPLTGEHHGRHENLLVGGSGALTQGETFAICPFDMNAAVPPDEIDLHNATVERFSVMREYARPLARQGLENLEAADCEARYVPGSCRNMKVNTRIEGLSSRPVLLPVWIMAYRYNQRLFRFLVNGQSGKATGHTPISWKKILMAAGLVAGLIAVATLTAIAIAASMLR